MTTAKTSSDNVTRRCSRPLCYAFWCYAFLGGVVAGACDTGIKPTATIAAPDSADQVLFGMSHYVTDAGIQRAHVRADTAYFYSPAQTAELRNVHITFYDTRGAETSTLTSRQGTRSEEHTSELQSLTNLVCRLLLEKKKKKNKTKESTNERKKQ